MNTFTHERLFELLKKHEVYPKTLEWHMIPNTQRFQNIIDDLLKELPRRELTGEDIWCEWYAGMTLQRREVSLERQSWEDLPEREKILDVFIARRLNAISTPHDEQDEVAKERIRLLLPMAKGSNPVESNWQIIEGAEAFVGHVIPSKRDGQKSDNENWEEFIGADGNKNLYLWEEGVEVCHPDESHEAVILTPDSEGKTDEFMDKVRYRRKRQPAQGGEHRNDARTPGEVARDIFLKAFAPDQTFPELDKCTAIYNQIVADYLHRKQPQPSTGETGTTDVTWDKEADIVTLGKIVEDVIRQRNEAQERAKELEFSNKVFRGSAKLVLADKAQLKKQLESEKEKHRQDNVIYEGADRQSKKELTNLNTKLEQTEKRDGELKKELALITQELDKWKTHANDLTTKLKAAEEARNNNADVRDAALNDRDSLQSQLKDTQTERNSFERDAEIRLGQIMFLREELSIIRKARDAALADAKSWSDQADMHATTAAGLVKERDELQARNDRQKNSLREIGVKVGSPDLDSVDTLKRRISALLKELESLRQRGERLSVKILSDELESLLGASEVIDALGGPLNPSRIQRLERFASALNSRLAPTWTPISTPPTSEDADRNGRVEYLFNNGTISTRDWNATGIKATHWRHTNLPDLPPLEPKVEDDGFEEWWGKQLVGKYTDKESARDAWKAAFAKRGEGQL